MKAMESVSQLFRMNSFGKNNNLEGSFIMIGRAILYTGLAMIAAAELRAPLDLLRFETIDVWGR